MEEVERIPLVEETARIDKRTVERGRVRITTEVETRSESVDAELWHEEVTIERVPIGQPVEQAPQVRQEGDVLVVPVIEEEVVVTKRLILKEEIHIRKTTRTTQVSEPVTLRRETATIVRTPTETP